MSDPAEAAPWGTAPGAGDPLRRTALHTLHVDAGGRMVPFAGYEMPVQYGTGVVAEHQHTRARAGLFDVSHMGIVELRGAGAADALERLVPSNLANLAAGRQRYTMLTTDEGGVIDDLMVARVGERLSMVVNAARKEHDLAHLRARLPASVDIRPRPELALLALQGPAAEAALATLAPDVADLGFMDVTDTTVAGEPATVSRSGYTGEDGFEIAVAAGAAVAVAGALLHQDEVELAGLGARDTLRLEAGLCLYGHELDETTSPVEAGQRRIVHAARRERCDFPGAARIVAEYEHGPSRILVGLRPHGRRPVRDGAALTHDGRPVGRVTSGGYGPTVGGPVALALVDPAGAAPGGELLADVRGHVEPCTVVPVPFVPHRYARGGSA
jgi:aminomethyltransferase